MIPRKETIRQPKDWQSELAAAITDPGQLLKMLDLPAKALGISTKNNQSFPLRVPRGFVARMRPGDPNDPLLRQVWPALAEEQQAPEFTTDPVGDQCAMHSPGVLQKYHGRSLIITTPACAIHCRYCFRRHFPYQQSHASQQQWQSVVTSCKQDPSIQEVILSGGDPLTMSNSKLAALLEQLTNLASVRRIRIHSRVPIVLPSRVDAGLIEALQRCSKPIVFVVHVNHPNEIDAEVRSAMHTLKSEGITLLNQSVLLKGVNDDVQCLIQLSEQLFEAGILPYYLHLLDRVAGAMHFDIAHAQAQIIEQRLRDSLPGYLVPRLVREIAGARSKVPLNPF